MTDEPQNLVLALLRELRSKQDKQFNDLNSELKSVDRRLTLIEEPLEDESGMVTHALGLGTGAVARLRQAPEQSEKTKSRVDELFARLEALEQR